MKTLTKRQIRGFTKEAKAEAYSILRRAGFSYRKTSKALGAPWQTLHRWARNMAKEK